MKFLLFSLIPIMGFVTVSHAMNPLAKCRIRMMMSADTATAGGYYPETEKEWLDEIAFDPHDDKLRHAFGQWLAARNDPRGEVVIRQIADRAMPIAEAVGNGFLLENRTYRSGIMFDVVRTRLPSRATWGPLTPEMDQMLDETAAKLTTITSEAENRWLDTEFGRALRKIIPFWRPIDGFHRGLPVVTLDAEALKNHGDDLVAMGVTQISVPTDSNELKSMLGNRRLRPLFKRLTYLRIPRHLGRRSDGGLSRDAFQRLLDPELFPNLIELDLGPNVDDSWVMDQFRSEGMRLPKLKVIITGTVQR